MAQRIHESIEVQAPVAEVFAYWSNFENFPNFMQNFEEVRMTGRTRATGGSRDPWARASSSTPKPPRGTRTRGIG
jgi:uncharacterized membrane protein